MDLFGVYTSTFGFDNDYINKALANDNYNKIVVFNNDYK